MERELESQLDAAGVPVVLPTYSVQYFHQRRSVVVEKFHLLMPGYLLVRCTENEVPDLLAPLRDGEMARALRGVPLPDTQIVDLLMRTAAHEFDVRLKDPKIPMPGKGARVRVTLLGMIGRVKRILGKFAEVFLDGVSRPVLVEPHGMIVV